MQINWLALPELNVFKTINQMAQAVCSPGRSRKLILFDWLYAFFEFMGRGFFALLIYLGLLTFTWGRPDAITPAHPVGRNDPCPCGSGLKAKRCCAA